MCLQTKDNGEKALDSNVLDSTWNCTENISTVGTSLLLINIVTVTYHIEGWNKYFIAVLGTGQRLRQQRCGSNFRRIKK